MSVTRKNLAVLLLGSVLTFHLAGCSDDSSSSDDATGSSTTPTAPTDADDKTGDNGATDPTLVTWSNEQGSGGMEAIVSGELSVNDRGCFAIGDDVLIAPPESTAEGQGITIPGLGTLSVGETVNGSGGYLDASQAVDYDATDCVSTAGGLVVLSS